jgi:serpin B
MLLSRLLPWLSIGAALAGCKGGARPVASTPKPAVTLSSSAARAPAAPPPPGTSAADPAASQSTPTAADVAADATEANAFAIHLLARTKSAGQNTVISGPSLRQSLGMAYIGARDTTAHEMTLALRLNPDPMVAARLARAELEAWQVARGNAELNVASRIWIDKGFTLRPNFTKTAESDYGAAPLAIDYSKPEEARKAINAWVSEKTRTKIPELLPHGAIDPSSRLVLTNAISFKGRWELPFPKNATKDEPFRIAGKKSPTVPTMHLSDTCRFLATGDVRVLELRYAESQLAMLVVLPDDAGPEALPNVESNLTVDVLQQWTSALATTRVNVALPRFTFRSGGPMSGPLRDLGMRTAFTDAADFSGIAEPRGSDRLFVNQIFHEAWVAVDEIGTEAAAATGTTMRTTSLLTGPVAEFRADHPFLFLIRDTKSGRILFAGRVIDPKT